jgi:hypothetical protein
MKRFNFPTQAWASCLSWHLGPLRSWLLLFLVVLIGSASLAFYWNHEAALLDVEAQGLLKKIKNKRIASSGVSPASGFQAINSGFSNDQVAQFELRLPSVQATKASPLGKFLSESKLKGVTLKQVDYVWSKSARSALPKLNQSSKEGTSQGLGVGKIEVNLNVEGSYLAVRAWLGELLYEESNVQVNAIQFQRLSRDSALINSVITLSVYFQEAT